MTTAQSTAKKSFKSLNLPQEIAASSVTEPIAQNTKSRKEILLELLELENDNLGNVGKKDEKTDEIPEQNDTINAVENNGTLTKTKRQLTEKQLDTLKKGQEIRNANREKRAEEKRQKEEEKKKQVEEKLVKKAIAVKKKQLKQQQILDEISDYDEEKEIKKIEEKLKPLAKPKANSGAAFAH